MSFRARLDRILVLLAVAICLSTISCSTNRDKKIKTFTAIFNMTPSKLQDVCGAPVRDVAGVLVANDGIRDLHYRDSNNHEIIFRFISEDGQRWGSFGVWRPSKSRALGIQLEGTDELLKRMPCLENLPPAETPVAGKVNSNDGQDMRFVRATFFQVQEVPGGVGEGPLGGIRINPPPPPPPRIEPIGGGLPELPPIRDFSQHSSDDSGGGDDSSGGGDDPPTDHTEYPFTVIPCPSDTLKCEVIGYYDFRSELLQAMTAEKEGEYDRTLKIVGRIMHRQVVIHQIPGLEVEDLRKEIFAMEAKVINIVFARLREDIKKLTPFEEVDTLEVKERKMDEVIRDEKRMKELWQNCYEDPQPVQVDTSNDNDEVKPSDSSNSDAASADRDYEHPRGLGENYNEGLRILMGEHSFDSR